MPAFVDQDFGSYLVVPSAIVLEVVRSEPGVSLEEPKARPSFRVVLQARILFDVVCVKDSF